MPRILDPLSEFALTVIGAFGLGLPIALVIIWVCS
jgi:hypothetical protein